MFTVWYKKLFFLVYIANFALHDNCEGGGIFVLLIRLNYIKP